MSLSRINETSIKKGSSNVVANQNPTGLILGGHYEQKVTYNFTVQPDENKIKQDQFASKIDALRDKNEEIRQRRVLRNAKESSESSFASIWRSVKETVNGEDPDLIEDRMDCEQINKNCEKIRELEQQSKNGMGH